MFNGVFLVKFDGVITVDFKKVNADWVKVTWLKLIQYTRDKWYTG